MKNEDEDKNISRRNFLKKLAATAVFTVPTIQTFSLLDSQSQNGWTWWTGHHHHKTATEGSQTPPLPPPPPGL
ncbi:MAG: twin-arginine translocation signal domain-containing protein [Candidatus Neomarinimicrobiota bacterium]